MKTGVLVLLDMLDMGGAENLASNIAVDIKNRGVYNPIICLTRRGGVLEQKLSESGVKYYILGRNHRFEIYKFYRIRKIIHDENIKLIHAHKPGSNFWAGILGKIFGLPVISHLHTHPDELGRIGGKAITKFIASMSSKIISISENVRLSLIEDEGISPSKIVAIQNGIKYRDYVQEPNNNLKAELGIDPDSKVIAIIAAFRKEKNHEMLLRAAKELLDKKQGYTFLLIGDGELREQIEMKARDLGISGSCIFTGLRTDIPNILSIIDIGVLCSVYEGIPLVVLEYMAASKPAICTDIKGVHEIIEDDRNGLLIPLDDTSALARAIERLCEDQSFADELRKNGFKTVSENFSEETMINKIENLYDKVLQDRF